MADIYQANINGFDLDIETIQDDFEKSVAHYEFPYKDGDLLEDMGQKARRIQVRCYFLNDRYVDHIEFLDSLQNAELIDFMHPKYGLLHGCIESAVVMQDRRDLCAQIDIGFVENLRDDIEPTAYVDVESAAESSYTDGQNDLMNEFSSDMAQDLGASAYDVLGRDLDPSFGIFEQFADLTGPARAYVRQIDAYARLFDGILNQIENPANSLIAVIDFGADLPGRLIGGMARVAERYGLLYAPLNASPLRFLNSLRAGMTYLQTAVASGQVGPASGSVITTQATLLEQAAAAPYNTGILPVSGQIPGTGITISGTPLTRLVASRMPKYIMIAAALRQALEMAYLYKADEAERDLIKSLSAQKSFDTLGNYTYPQMPAPVMTINHLESTLGTVRLALKAAVDNARDMESPKTMARDLLTYVNKIKLEREKIKQVSVPNPMPLHLICLQYGLPYNDAARILAINNIPNPNFVSGGINIYAAG
jgi:hypothetical protein